MAVRQFLTENLGRTMLFRAEFARFGGTKNTGEKKRKKKKNAQKEKGLLTALLIGAEAENGGVWVPAAQHLWLQEEDARKLKKKGTVPGSTVYFTAEIVPYRRIYCIDAGLKGIRFGNGREEEPAAAPVPERIRCTGPDGRETVFLYAGASEGRLFFGNAGGTDTAVFSPAEFGDMTAAAESGTYAVLPEDAAAAENYRQSLRGHTDAGGRAMGQKELDRLRRLCAAGVRKMREDGKEEEKRNREKAVSAGNAERKKKNPCAEARRRKHASRKKKRLGRQKKHRN